MILSESSGKLVIVQIEARKLHSAVIRIPDDRTVQKRTKKEKYDID